MIFDKKAVNDRFSGDEEFITEIVEVYLQDFTVQMSNLEKALHNNDSESLRKIGHALKGASQNIGAAVLADNANQIEEAGVSNQLENVPQLLIKLKKNIHDFNLIISASSLKIAT